VSAAAVYAPLALACVLELNPPGWQRWPRANALLAGDEYANAVRADDKLAL
jgi:hypothetical protein